MDNKRLFVFIAISLLMVLGWQYFLNWQAKRNNWVVNSPQENTAPATAPAVESPSSAPATGSLTSAPATARAKLEVLRESMKPAPALLGSDKPNDPAFAMAVKIPATGNGLEFVTLNHFKAPGETGELYRFQSPYPGYESSRPLMLRSINIEGRVIDLTGVDWTPEGSATQTTARYQVTIGDPTPLVRIHRTYELSKVDDAAHPNTLGFELYASFSIENLSPNKLKISAIWNDTTLPPRELERGNDRTIATGFLVKDSIELKLHPIEEFTKDKPWQEVSKHDKDYPMEWVGGASTYFNAFVQPRAAEGLIPKYTFKTAAQLISLNGDFADVDQRAVVLTTESYPFEIAPGKTQDFTLNVFLGPKDRHVLENPYYSALPRDYDVMLKPQGWCGEHCTSDKLISALVWLLAQFQFVTRDWGLSIIILVCLVRAILHPITKRSQISMAKMAKLQPEMEKLKKKYGDNKEELNRAMMQFYKEQGASPFLGCLPMFLQMPIWIALYTSLQTTFELRQQPFLYGLTWIKDLAQPDRLWVFNPPVHLLFGITLSSINLLPILMGVVMYLQQKYTPKPAATTPEQAQQQKMMTWMTLLFPLFLYSGPSGLNLYILTSTALGIIEARIVRDHIKQREEAEAKERVIIDAPPTRASRRLQKDAREEETQAQPKGFLARFMARMQQMAEEAKKAQEKDRDKRRRK